MAVAVGGKSVPRRLPVKLLSTFERQAARKHSYGVSWFDPSFFTFLCPSDVPRFHSAPSVVLVPVHPDRQRFNAGADAVLVDVSRQLIHTCDQKEVAHVRRLSMCGPSSVATRLYKKDSL